MTPSLYKRLLKRGLKIRGYEDESVCMADEYSTMWFSRGKLHRLNGPAVISLDLQYWFQEGVLHREYGPAIKGGDGREAYFLRGRPMTKDEMEKSKA